MIYKCIYETPEEFSNMIMTSDGEFLTGLYFNQLNENVNEVNKDLEIFQSTKKWLDIYFSGNIPDFTPALKLENITPFRQEVIDIMNTIAYGQTITYGDISEMIAKKRGIKKMSSQAVGQAVGWNPICIIIPCHRVIGKDGNLTGYGGGITNKIAL
ncbi:MAG: methylated-DNA--[protein]-cysteine S-methyltransferase [Erysipelotrichaceae bacterium]|uniref:methylated-DNA--[protein]-cysteine S-methyltransferase n=1 Tax=Floccifex sp. TaxID=2815810 RepID=UPI002A74B407|nr:methylated-DNA--[protein]-cysteine S-methyltransferase [Floccifex sp.]MDD7281852.1 methylated-DNA--[protein]-cysteine S-methyltransferase [Erysipelotrichaceae bacterium]MDY2958706.1 methylated-DNA--[protein]-cysteine S-methyltransferase [Floccifex sp.]